MLLMLIMKKNVEIAVPLNYLSNFLRTLEMPLLYCEIDLTFSTCSDNCVIFSATGEIKFKITDTKIDVPVVTLSTQGNVKLLEKLKSGIKRTIGTNINQ